MTSSIHTDMSKEQLARAVVAARREGAETKAKLDALTTAAWDFFEINPKDDLDEYQRREYRIAELIGHPFAQGDDSTPLASP